MYNLRSRLQRVNYRTLHGLPDNDMSARKHTEHSESERDTEESQVPSDQDHERHEEIPDETAEELKALIAKQESTLDNARQKVKLVALKEKLKELEKETLADQLKLARATGTSKTGSKVPKNIGSKHKEVSSRDLREFEELSHKVENASAKWVFLPLPLQPQQMNPRQVKKATMIPLQPSVHQERNEVSGT